MSSNLWELRKKRGMTVKQLAAKSGVPAKSIYAYEAGEPIKIADLGKLAKVLYVDKTEIKIQSDPVPKTKPEPPKPPAKPAPPAKPEAASSSTSPAREKKLPPPRPAAEGQLHHLRGLLEKLGMEETAVAAEIGKPVNELTFLEARTWLKTLDGRIQAEKPQRPPNTRRWRATQPEIVDEFEANYLQARQEAKDVVTFTLLNETTFSGIIIGFSPYNITIQQADGTETTIQKLALAYYATSPELAKEAA